VSRWLETVILLLGILAAATGVVAILLSGLDPIIGSAGLLLSLIAGAIVWHYRRKHPLPHSDSTIVAGRSVQRPPSEDEQSESKFRRKM